MLNKDTISVIVPVYNSQDYLCQCLTSIQKQTYPFLEIILVDDGSTDTSGKICDGFAAKDKRFKVFHQTNSGAASARNLGIKHATGTFLSFIDSDDWVEPNLYEVTVAALKKSGADWLMWQEPFRLRPYFKPGLHTGPDYIQAVCGMFQGKSMGPAAWMQIYKRKIFQEKQIQSPTNLKNFEDLALVLQYALSVQNIYYLSKGPFYHYTQNPHSITHSYNPDLQQNVIDEIDYFRTLLSKTTLPYRTSLRKWIAWELFRRYAEELKGNSPNSYTDKIKIIKQFYEHSTLQKELQQVRWGDLSQRQSLVLFLTKLRYYKTAYLLAWGLQKFSLCVRPLRPTYRKIKTRIIQYLWQ